MDDNIKYLTPKEQEAAKAREELYYMKKSLEEEKKLSSNYFFGFWGATKVKRNTGKLYCVIIACVIAIPVGEFLGSIIYVMGNEETAIHTSYYVTYYINNFGLFMKYNFGNLILGYVFTGIGGYGVFKSIRNHDKKLKEMEEYLAQYEES